MRQIGGATVTTRLQTAAFSPPIYSRPAKSGRKGNGALIQFERAAFLKIPATGFAARSPAEIF
jgi:hypothetical protein